MHKIPMTGLERTGLIKHGLPIGAPSQLSDAFRNGVIHASKEIAELQAALAERDAKLAALEKQEPVAYRLPKAGVDNGYNYCDSLDGEEQRFLKLWEKLYAAATDSAIAAGAMQAEIDEFRAALKDRDATITRTVEHLRNAINRADETSRLYMVQGAKLAALEKQEPVAWMNNKRDMTYFGHYNKDDLPLYAAAGAAPVPDGYRLVSIAQLNTWGVYDEETEPKDAP